MKSEALQGLVKPSELRPFVRLNLLHVLMDVLKLNSVNSLYEHTAGLSGTAFVSQVLDRLQVSYDVNEKELNHIPREGAFVSISNHPYGGVDGLILLHLLRRVRPDVKVLANHLLGRIEPLRDMIIPVNPFEREAISSKDISQIRTILSHLENHHALAMFPAGQVSTFHLRTGKVEDPKWNAPAMKMIKKMEVPVVPIYFDGGNSLYFYLLSAINPRLRTAKLPSELFNKQNRVVHVRVGRPISVEEQRRFYTPGDYEGYLRSRTYILGNAAYKEPNGATENLSKGFQTSIIPPQERSLMRTEIGLIPDEQKLISTSQFDLFLSPVSQIPVIINEIGRLREVTFRDCGEGTNQPIDLDHHDLYYRHLFIWDRKASKIAGAYRLGLGDEIMKTFGVKGFYLQSLFRIKGLGTEMLESTIELGRSFVVKEYQQRSICLHLLWKGLFKFIVENARYRHIIGPVSISKQYSRLSKDLMLHYLRTYHCDHDLAFRATARKPYKWKKETKQLTLIHRHIRSDVQRLDRIILEIEGDKGIPVLLKKYLGQNAMVLGFNIDPKFNRVVDCLMLLRISDIPENTIDQLGKEITNVAVYQRFYQEKFLAYNFIPQY